MLSQTRGMRRGEREEADCFRLCLRKDNIKTKNTGGFRNNNEWVDSTKTEGIGIHD
jgi:hypothetical protein